MSRNDRDPVLEVLSAILIQKKLPGIRVGVVTNSKNDGVWLSGAITSIFLFHSDHLTFACPQKLHECCL